MAITINIYYTGENGDARAFADEMMSSGVVADIRRERGNLRYEYFISLDDPETILLIDQWENDEALAAHHSSTMMKRITELRDKYELSMRVERFQEDDIPSVDERFIRK